MIEIVPMTEHHVQAVAALEKLCFSAPWSENSVRSELTNPLSLWLVAMVGDRVAGYVGSQSVMGEADMMNIAVEPSFRRRGIAESLVAELITRLGGNGVHALMLEVRVSNESAIALYQKLGFVQVGRRPNYYANPKEDALILRREWEV